MPAGRRLPLKSRQQGKLKPARMATFGDGLPTGTVAREGPLLPNLLFGILAALGPYTVSGNFPADLYGPVDTRMSGLICAGGPCIWGHADSAILPIKFRPPAGYRVRILVLRGDVVAWIKSLPGDSPTPAESAAGILAGFQTTSSSGSTHCDYCADGTPLYVQDSVTDKQPKTRAPFNYTDVGLLLDDDNILTAKIGSWLNTTGKPIHIEVTYTIQFRYERKTDDLSL
jgi:hypothetical protein